MQIGQIKILLAILAAVTAIGGVATVWTTDNTKEKAIREKATIARDIDPENAKPITGDDLF